MSSAVPDFLYHGSAVAFKAVDVRKGRGYKDFGRGFYMSVERRQVDGVPHGYDVVIGPTADDDTRLLLKNYIDGVYGDSDDPEAKATLLRLLKPERLGVQWFVGSQSVVDRLVCRLEPVDWRECL